MNFSVFDLCQGVSIDTRSIQQGNLFVCLKGANYDANDFVEQALEKGARFVVTNRTAFIGNPSVIVVDDTLNYLQELARWHRRRFAIPVIGITGSNGKTTSKELIASVLSKKYETLYTQGNLNNHIGVPLTLLRLTATHEIAVIEIGANRPGDIEELCAIAEPTHGIITNIGKAHLEGFGDFNGVFTTKTALFRSVSAANGVLFVNHDDAVLMNASERFKRVTFGDTQQATISGVLEEMTPFVKLTWGYGSVRYAHIETAMVGRYNYYNFLAACCVGHYFKVSDEAITTAIRSYVPSNNRSQLIKSENNTLLLDAYNANPSSMKGAISSFAEMRGAQKLLILGDMFELGAESALEHQTILEQIDALGMDAILVGTHFYAQKADFILPKFHFFETKEACIAYLQTLVPKHTLILIKGSRGIGLEAVVPFL